MTGPVGEATGAIWARRPARPSSPGAAEGAVHWREHTRFQSSALHGGRGSHYIGSMLKVMIAPVTPFQQNCSIVWDDETMEGTAVDPGGDFDMLKQAIDEQGIKVTKVLLTHGHVDHASAAGTMAEHYGVKIEGPHKDDLFLIEGLPEVGPQVQFPGLQAVRARPLAGERRDRDASAT